MQYKIPVQIENEDPILFGLGLKQLIIIMIGGGVSFQIFDGLRESLGKEIALIPALFVLGLTILIAVFKHSEMTFIPFILALLRNMVNPTERLWVKSIDSFQPIDIGYVVTSNEKATKEVDFRSKRDKLQSLENNLDKI